MPTELSAPRSAALLHNASIQGAPKGKLTPADRRTAPPLPFLTAPILIGLVLVAACISWVSVRAVPLPWETSHPEAAVAYHGLKFVQSGKIYPSINEPPYTPVAYMPLYYVLLGIPAKLGHLGLDGVLRVGRTMSVLAYLLIALLVYRWGRREGAAPTLAFIGAALVIGQYDAFPWNVTARPDFLAILLTFLGLYVLSCADSEWLVMASGICLSLALLLKQSVIAAPLAAGVWLLLQRRLRSAAILTASTVLPVLGCVAVLQVRGDHFFANMSALGHAGHSSQGALDLVHREFGGANAEYTLIGLAIIGVVCAYLKPTASRTLIALYFLTSWLVALRTISHIGSNYNYFLEPWAVSSLLAILGLMQLHEWAGSGRIFLAVVLLGAYPFLHGSEQALRLISDDGLIKSHSLTGLVRNAEVLTDIPYLGAHSKNPELLDSYFASILEERGLWKPDPIIRKVHARQYSLIMVALNSGGVRRYRGISFISPSIASEIRANYRPFCVLQVRKDMGQIGYSAVMVLIPDGDVASPPARTPLASAGCKEIEFVNRPGYPSAPPRWYTTLNW